MSEQLLDLNPKEEAISLVSHILSYRKSRLQQIDEQEAAEKASLRGFSRFDDTQFYHDHRSAFEMRIRAAIDIFASSAGMEPEEIIRLAEARLDEQAAQEQESQALATKS